MRAEIVRINAEHRWAPGTVKMWHLLRTEGFKCGKHRVRRLRKLENIQTTRIKRFRVMQAMERVQPPAPDLVKRGFRVTAPNTIWVGDMTALRTKEGWLHLAIVLDLFARRVVGWSMDTTQAATLPLAALSMALAQRKPNAGLIFHSDHGLEYASTFFSQRLAKLGIEQSMNRPRTMNDNVHIESFFHSMKSDGVHGIDFEEDAHMRGEVKNYMPFYNNTRRHSSLGYVSPATYEQQLA